VKVDTISATDAELHEAWRSGDGRAAANLVIRYRSRLRLLGEQQLGLSSVDADDLAQQVLMEAPRSRFEPRESGGSYFGWLAVIARRKASRMFTPSAGECPVRRLTTPWTGTWRSHMIESIDAMPETMGDVFLRRVAGYTVHEIAEQLELPHATVRMRIHRGRTWLRDRGH
jgi:DNA-directed RNA polymerase specialized sigma24 family protein